MEKVPNPLSWIKAGAFLMCLAIALGAFGAHFLKMRLGSERMAVYQTAVLFHMVHALALIATAWVLTLTRDTKVLWAGRLFLAGIFLFSGSLYLLAITGLRGFGMITPLGGICWMAGWLLLALTKKKI